ncbi:MAG TPA: SGNH/GDSL hydrolase family protein, partial [Candidatus Saccharimonadales bacterium]
MSGLQQLLRMFVCLLVTIGFLASLLRAPAQTKADTATSPSWITGLLVHHDEVLPAGQSAPAASPTGGHCLDYTFNFKVKPIGQAVQYNEQPEACAVITNYGIAAGRYLHENGEKYAGRMSRGNTVYLPVPNSNKLLEIKGGFFPKKHLHVYRDFINQSLVRTENNWFMTYAPSGSQIVQDQAGNLVNIDSNFLKTSTNSLWAIAFSPNKSLIRVNLDSTEPLPFGLSTKPLTGAVSNSGQFVAAHYINEATLIYDLSICGSVPSTINGPVDCDERDISQYLIDQFGPNNGVERIKFLDDYHLELYVKQTNANNEIYFRKVQLTLNGHQIIDNSSTYIAMGDSFASGEGDLDDSWYELGTDEPENKCHLSRRSYPYLLDLALGFEEFHSVACSGAETVHVLNIRQNNELPPVNSLGEWLPGVVPQLELLKFSPQFVTISIGGNDLGFKDKLINCLLPTTCDYADNPEKRANVAKEIANLFKTLTNAYKQLVVKTDAQTKIYVVGYPQIIQPAGACGLNVHLDSAEREFAYQTAKYLNQIIKFAAARAGVYYLDTESAFGGFNLCSGVDDQDMVVNGLSITNTPAFRLNNGWLSFGGRAKFVLPGFSESYHPNPNGHQLLKQSIMALTDNNPALFNVCVESAVKVCPQDAQIPLPNETYWGQSTVDFVASLNNNETAGSLPPIYHKLL